MERNNRIFNNLARSPIQTYSVCFTFIAHWVNLLSGTSTEATSHAFGQIQSGESSYSHSDKAHGRGADIDSDDMCPSLLRTPDFLFVG